MLQTKMYFLLANKIGDLEYALARLDVTHEEKTKATLL